MEWNTPWGDGGDAAVSSGNACVAIMVTLLVTLSQMNVMILFDWEKDSIVISSFTMQGVCIVGESSWRMKTGFGSFSRFFIMSGADNLRALYYTCKTYLKYLIDTYVFTSFFFLSDI